MTIYAVGDIQGCYQPLCALLDRIGFVAATDRLWFVGDLVNRGAGSLETLRWATAHADRVTSVLGNHDLHLLARHAGVGPTRRADTLDAVLAAPDRDELLSWLRQRPLLYEEDGFVLVHGGLPPFWTLEQTRERAREAEEMLRGPRWVELVSALREVSRPEQAATWSSALDPIQRAALTVNALTRIRMCSPDGMPDWRFKGHPRHAPAGLRPWFELGQRPAEVLIIFGHWAALGLFRAPGVICIDSGCAWGESLTALRLPDLVVFSQPSCA